MAEVASVHLRKGKPDRKVRRPEEGVMGRLTDTACPESKISLQKGRKRREASAVVHRALESGIGTMGNNGQRRVPPSIEAEVAIDLVRIEVGICQVETCASHQIMDVFLDQCPGQG